MSLMDNHAFRTAKLGMDLQERLGLAGMASKIAAMGLTDNHALSTSRLGMDFQEKFGLTGMASKIAAMGLTENHALSAARLGLDIQEKLGLTGMASKFVAMGLTETHALSTTRLGMDFQEKFGLVGIATKMAAMGLTENHALSATRLGMDFQEKFGLAGMASKIAAMGLTDNNTLRATRLGMDFQEKFGLTGIASKITAMGLLHNTLGGDVNTPGFQTAVKGMLTSPVVEKAFSHLINESDFEVTAMRLCLDSSIKNTTNYDSISVDSAEIEPFDQSKSFLEWYENLSPFYKHAITAVFAILLSIIANLLTPFVENLIHIQKHETKAIVKAYKNSNHERVPKDEHYRFVSATRLHVREKPRTDSAIIATATLGKVVSVDYKKKSWAKISYLDENDDVVIGWVLIRHVSNFKR